MPPPPLRMSVHSLGVSLHISLLASHQEQSGDMAISYYEFVQLE
jgi:hypothetical protein